MADGDSPVSGDKTGTGSEHPIGPSDGARPLSAQLFLAVFLPTAGAAISIAIWLAGLSEALKVDVAKLQTSVDMLESGLTELRNSAADKDAQRDLGDSVTRLTDVVTALQISLNSDMAALRSEIKGRP